MSGIDMPVAKKNTKTTAPKKSATTRRRNNITVLKNTIRLLQSDLADALNREKAAKDRARVVIEERASLTTRLREANSALEVALEQREALAEKYVNTTLDAHEIAKYAVRAYEKALLTEDALTAADEYIECLRAELSTAYPIMHAAFDALAKALNTSREVVYALADHVRVTDGESTTERRRVTYRNRVDRYECKEELTTLDQKVRDYATMPVDKVKMRLDTGLPVASMQEGTTA